MLRIWLTWMPYKVDVICWIELCSLMGHSREEGCALVFGPLHVDKPSWAPTQETITMLMSTVEERWLETSYPNTIKAHSLWRTTANGEDHDHHQMFWSTLIIYCSSSEELKTEVEHIVVLEFFFANYWNACLYSEDKLSSFHKFLLFKMDILHQCPKPTQSPTAFVKSHKYPRAGHSYIIFLVWKKPFI